MAGASVGLILGDARGTEVELGRAEGDAVGVAVGLEPGMDDANVGPDDGVPDGPTAQVGVRANGGQNTMKWVSHLVSMLD